MQSDSAKNFPELMRNAATEAGLKETGGGDPIPDISHGTYEGPKYLFEYVIQHKAEDAVMTIRVTDTSAQLQEDVEKMMHAGHHGGATREYQLNWDGHAWISRLDGSKRSNADLTGMIVSMII